MANRLEQLRNNLRIPVIRYLNKTIKELEEDGYTTPDKFNQHLQNLTPERLVDRLRSFQKNKDKGIAWTIGGLTLALISTQAPNLPITAGIENLDILRELYGVSIASAFMGGGLIAVSNLKKIDHYEHTLKTFIYPEIQRRLTTPTQPAPKES